MIKSNFPNAHSCACFFNLPIEERKCHLGSEAIRIAFFPGFCNFQRAPENVFELLSHNRISISFGIFLMIPSDLNNRERLGIDSFFTLSSIKRASRLSAQVLWTMCGAVYKKPVFTGITGNKNTYKPFVKELVYGQSRCFRFGWSNV